MVRNTVLRTGDELQASQNKKLKKWIRKMKKKLEENNLKRKIFAIGDLHLDHANIIKYCNRPFSSVEEMNNVIVRNWNKAIMQGDTVYFLGDMSFGKGSKKTDYWLEKLNGNIVFIRGNHDRSKKINFFTNLIFQYSGQRFLLIHRPEDVPVCWKEWVIHGHHHNNDLKSFPFINGKQKTINVGVELLNYKPLDLNCLFELDFKRVKFMETINSKPVYKR